MTRYDRQVAVPAMGAERDRRLRTASALVVGAGGLAAPVLQYLAGAGVGHLRLVDFDHVDIGNLHRQTLFRSRDIGRPKVRAAAEALADLNADCRIEPVEMALGPGNVVALAAGCEIVLDCADSFAVSYVLSDFCLARSVPIVSASVVGTDGYCGAFCGGAPSLRAVFPDLPDRLGSCVEDGVLGPIVGVIGSAQAQMALALIAGLDPSPLGRLATYDGATHRAGGFDFAGAPEPDRCFRFIDRGEISSSDFVVDLRAPEEGPLAHHAATRHRVTDFGPGGPRPDAAQRAVLCCRSGQRSWTAATRLAAVWEGEIAVVALGDETPVTPAGPPRDS